jgi:hypothetical protein
VPRCAFTTTPATTSERSDTGLSRRYPRLARSHYPCPEPRRTCCSSSAPSGRKCRLTDGVDARYPLNDHALCTARPQLAEHAGDPGEAASLYAEAARRWRRFGNVPERAYALLGQGRCLVALGRRTQLGRSGRRATSSSPWATARRWPRRRHCWRKLRQLRARPLRPWPRARQAPAGTAATSRGRGG